MRDRIFLIAVMAAAAAAVLDGVAEGAVRTLRVTPARAEAAMGEPLRFAAALPGGGEPAAASLEWSVIPPRLGAVDGSGLFVGAMPGQGVVRVQASVDGARYRGHAVIRVTGGETGRVAVEIRPESVETEPGGEVRLGASARDAESGAHIPGRFEWIVTPHWLGTIGPDDTFVAGSMAGSGRITVRFTGGHRFGAAHVPVRVGGGEGSAGSIFLEPERTVLPPGGSVDFRLGGEVPDGAAVDWVAVPALLGAVGGDGSFRAGPIPMEGRIIATVRSDRGSTRAVAFVRLAGLPTGREAVVHPAEAILRAGESVRFELRGGGADGGGSAPATVRWELSGEPAGVIGPDGLFEAAADPAQAVSIALVTGIREDPATGAVLAGHARVTVILAPENYQIVVRPLVAEVPPGEEVRFQAENVPAGIPLDWSVEPRTIGTITPDGLFTANEIFSDAASGEFYRREGVVIATVRDGARRQTGQARIVVGGDGFGAALAIEPPELNVGRSATDIDNENAASFGTFHVRTTGLANSSSIPLVHWRLEGSPFLRLEPEYGRSTTVVLNTLDKRAGDVVIRAKVIAELVENGRRTIASAPVTVRLTDVGIVLGVTPASVELAVGEKVPLAIQVRTRSGRPLDTALVQLTGSFEGKRLGFLNPQSGVFTATEAGRGTLRVRATLKGASGVQADAPVDVRVTAPESDTGGNGGNR